MATLFGEVSWDQQFGGKKGENNKDLWLTLDSGDNEVRLVTAPYQYLMHKVKPANAGPKDFGKKVNCSGPANEGECPICATGDKAKRRWLLGVISRKTGTYKVLDISWGVFSAIQSLAKNARWGDPKNYDINIHVDKNAAPNDYYRVQPIPKEPLSVEDQTLRDNADINFLKERVTPPSPAQVQERFDKILGLKTEGAEGTQSETKTAAKASVDLGDDFDAKDFPAYEG